MEQTQEQIRADKIVEDTLAYARRVIGSALYDRAMDEEEVKEILSYL